MRTNEFNQLDETVDVAAKHACRALLALEDLRFSHDPALRGAYREVHDLIGDLGCLRVQLGTMQLAPRPRGQLPRQAQASRTRNVLDAALGSLGAFAGSLRTEAASRH